MDFTREQMLAALESAETGPTEQELADAPTLNPWRLELWSDHFRLYGICEDHPEIDDQHVTASPLLALNADEVGLGHDRDGMEWGLTFKLLNPKKSQKS